MSRSRSWWAAAGQPPVLFPVVWLIFYVPRIWRFGMYYGDWADLVRVNPFEIVWWFFNSRPISIPIFYVLPRLIGFHPAIWQSLLCASMLAACCLFYKILIRSGLLLERPEEGSIGTYRVSADAAVACWLLFPWTLGWTAWPTLLMGQVALLFFLLSMHLLLNAETKGQVVAAAVVYALCDLTYEPFYFAFVPFLVILFISNERRQFSLIAFLFFSVQIVAVGYNRLMAHIMADGGAAKTLDLAAFLRLPNSTLGAFKELVSAARPAAWLVWVASVVAAVMLGLVVKRGTPVALRYAIVVVFCLGAISVSVLQFNLATYHVSGDGENSRTTIAISIWIAMLILAFVRGCWSSTLPRARGISIVVVAALMIGYGVGLNHQNGLWAFAWRDAVRIVAAAPAVEIAKLPANATIVYVGPTEIGAINYISQWPMFMGLPTYHPETALPAVEGVYKGGSELQPLPVRIAGSSEQPVAVRPLIVKASYQTLTWDGRELVLDFPPNWTQKFGASLVYEWDAYRGTLRRMEPNTPFGTAPR